jgi:hypothetical protein
MSLHGWLVIDKPAGMTSAQVVGKVKRLLKPLKIGHAGTLDPFATGVLPLALGVELFPPPPPLAVNKLPKEDEPPAPAAFRAPGPGTMLVPFPPLPTVIVYGVLPVTVKKAAPKTPDPPLPPLLPLPGSPPPAPPPPLTT